MPALTQPLIPSGAVGRDLKREDTKPKSFDIEQYLAGERAKDLLRFSTAGSVDDGKSTLIGRLLYDTQSVYEDQIHSIAGKGTISAGQLDLALLTDGLRAEREQGITIDVAYRYFATARRKFIIADTPGHEQYTRNMATGASTADVAVVLVDARNGVLVQSRRHAYIAALLGVPHLIVAVNKMDLVDYSESIYQKVSREFEEFFLSLEEHSGSTLHFVPVSALLGDNVARGSARMPWYTGPSLLGLLEILPAAEGLERAPFRMAVQRVLRPTQDFRGFAGQIASGTVQPGDAVQVLPSGAAARVRSIVTYDGELAHASAPLSICLTLDREIDVSRGDMIVLRDQAPTVARSFAASLVWMDMQPLALGRRYLLKHTTRTVVASVRLIRYAVDVADLSRRPARSLALNGIGLVELETQQPLLVDSYGENRHTGSFVLIDPESNATIAAGMVREVLANVEAAAEGPVTAEERSQRRRHTGAHLALSGPVEFADQVERALFELGAVVFRCEPDDLRTQQAIVEGGGIAISLKVNSDEAASAGVGAYVAEIAANTSRPAAVLTMLRKAGVLLDEAGSGAPR